MLMKAATVVQVLQDFYCSCLLVVAAIIFSFIACFILFVIGA